MERSINWYSIVVILAGILFLIFGTVVAAGPFPEIGYAMLLTGFVLIAGMCLAAANPDETSLVSEINKFG